MKTYNEILARIENPALQQCCRNLYQGPHTKLGMWPASLSHHHAYPGGLWTHTLEVASIALDLIDGGSVSVRWTDCIITACLWHDVGKVDEYVLVRPDEVPEGRRKLEAVGGMVWTKGSHIKDGEHPHIQLSADAFVYAIRGANTKIELIQAIESMILSHHGRKEWGSPIEPQSKEAELVHFADMISARMGAKL